MVKFDRELHIISQRSLGFATLSAYVPHLENLVCMWRTCCSLLDFLPWKQAKRDANRESARKCRERKRDREQSVMSEADVLRMEVEQLRLALAAERTKTAMLEKLLLEGDSALGLGVVKRIRLE